MCLRGAGVVMAGDTIQKSRGELSEIILAIEMLKDMLPGSFA